MSPSLIEQLERARAAEKEQALFYRSLAAEAEDRGDTDLGQRFHELHADEQHHLSRLTARLIEVGHTPVDLSDVRAPRIDLDGWREPTQSRETAEVARYAAILEAETMDAPTRALLSGILDVERQHAELLGGKWTMA